MTLTPARARTLPTPEGDPHFTTFDGLRFDFFGVGEYWMIKSALGTFDVQTRQFKVRRRSLLAAAFCSHAT